MLEEAADRGSAKADQFTRTSGEKLPTTVEGLGALLSVLYRAACCAWGCGEGDHQLEWLSGRVINQGMSSYRLIRAAYYDESLMLIRGIGEIANLLWLFAADRNQLTAWKSASRRERLSDFGPGAVRGKLKKLVGIGAPIDDERYRRLCEVGTHPVPGFAPGHFSGTGRPVLGVLLQPVGVYVSATELAFAISMCAVPLSKLLDLPAVQAKDLKTRALSLLRSLGAFTILNYNELLAESLLKSDQQNLI